MIEFMLLVSVSFHKVPRKLLGLNTLRQYACDCDYKTI